MVSITLSVPEEVRVQMKRFPEINWSAFVRSCIEAKSKELAWKQEMLEKLNSPEEQELIRWSVELGRKAKEGSFKRLLSKLSKKERAELLNVMSPEQRKKYE